MVNIIVNHDITVLLEAWNRPQECSCFSREYWPLLTGILVQSWTIYRFGTGVTDSRVSLCLHPFPLKQSPYFLSTNLKPHPMILGERGQLVEDLLGVSFSGTGEVSLRIGTDNLVGILALKHVMLMTISDNEVQYRSQPLSLISRRLQKEKNSQKTGYSIQKTNLPIFSILYVGTWYTYHSIYFIYSSHNFV